jgi:hypothetical protein
MTRKNAPRAYHHCYAVIGGEMLRRAAEKIRQR